jgi:hypothetical protein
MQAFKHDHEAKENPGPSQETKTDRDLAARKFVY